ncbi:MAG: hypothetical protein AB9834_14125 [Lentimicrobium sp.]
MEFTALDFFCLHSGIRVTTNPNTKVEIAVSTRWLPKKYPISNIQFPISNFSYVTQFEVEVEAEAEADTNVKL